MKKVLSLVVLVVAMLPSVANAKRLVILEPATDTSAEATAATSAALEALIKEQGHTPVPFQPPQDPCSAFCAAKALTLPVHNAEATVKPMRWRQGEGIPDKLTVLLQDGAGSSRGDGSAGDGSPEALAAGLKQALEQAWSLWEFRAGSVVKITGSPEGGAIQVDNRTLLKTLPAEVRLPPGTHVVAVSARGYKRAATRVEVPNDREAQLEVALKLEAETTLAPAPVPAPKRQSLAHVVVPTLMAIGGASAVAVGTVGLLKRRRCSEFHPVEGARCQTYARGNAPVSGAFFGAGVALLGGATLWLLLSRKSAKTVAGIDAGPGHVSVHLRGEFQP